MPIILAKTIIGLDNFKEQNRLSSSLLLLQVCNQNLYFIFILALTFTEAVLLGFQLSKLALTFA